MARIVVDPITRIEGHLRIEAEVEAGKISNAWSSATMFRGIEIILKGRDPRDAWVFTQRICGVCTTVHAITSVRAVENALGIDVPENAELIRSLIAGLQQVQDHVIHFYHLHAFDWVDIVSALGADPVNTGTLGPFDNAVWGHPAYKLPPEANLMAVAHYLEALEWQRDVIKGHAILGGKNPHLQTYLVGGMAVPLDLNSQQAVNAHSIATLQSLFKKARTFVEQVYVPDLLAGASFYPEWTQWGAGVGNYMSSGDFPTTARLDPAQLFLPRGIVFDKRLDDPQPLDMQKISEYVAHSYYDYQGGNDQAPHPFHGETNPRYTGPQPPYEFLDTDGKYSWLKAPRYDDRPMEVGPLARMLVAYAKGS